MASLEIPELSSIFPGSCASLRDVLRAAWSKDPENGQLDARLGLRSEESDSKAAAYERWLSRCVAVGPIPGSPVPSRHCGRKLDGIEGTVGADGCLEYDGAVLGQVLELVVQVSLYKPGEGLRQENVSSDVPWHPPGLNVLTFGHQRVYASARAHTQTAEASFQAVSTPYSGLAFLEDWRWHRALLEFGPRALLVVLLRYSVLQDANDMLVAEPPPRGASWWQVAGIPFSEIIVKPSLRTLQNIQPRKRPRPESSIPPDPESRAPSTAANSQEPQHSDPAPLSKRPRTESPTPPSSFLGLPPQSTFLGLPPKNSLLPPPPQSTLSPPRPQNISSKPHAHEAAESAVQELASLPRRGMLYSGRFAGEKGFPSRHWLMGAEVTGRVVCERVFGERLLASHGGSGPRRMYRVAGMMEDMLERLRKERTLDVLLHRYCPRQGSLVEVRVDNVGRFLCEALLKLLPKQMMGRPRGRRMLLDRVARFVSSGRFEGAPIELAMGMPVLAFPWLKGLQEQKSNGGPRSARLASAMLTQWTAFVLSDLVVPLVRANFVASESGSTRHRVCFFRKSDWANTERVAWEETKERLSLTEDVENDRAAPLRLLPKKHWESHISKPPTSPSPPPTASMRPIANLSAAGSAGSATVVRRWKGMDRVRVSSSSSSSSSRVISIRDERRSRRVDEGKTPMPAFPTPRRAPSINDTLREVHELLRTVHLSRPARAGAAVFNRDGAHAALAALAGARGTRERPLIAVAADLDACYDRIPHEQLLRATRDAVLASGLQERDSILQRRFSALCARQGPKRPPSAATLDPWNPLPAPLRLAPSTTGHLRHRVLALPPAKQSQPSELSTILARAVAAASRTTRGANNVVLVSEQQPRAARGVVDLWTDLEHHVRCHRLRFRGKVYRQDVGLPQGSVLSTLLCNLYLGAFESTVLFPVLAPLATSHSVLVRLTDDYLLLTDSPHLARAFLSLLQQQGTPWGVILRPDKTRSNTSPSFEDPQSTWFSWCGLQIHTQTGEVRPLHAIDVPLLRRVSDSPDPLQPKQAYPRAKDSVVVSSASLQDPAKGVISTMRSYIAARCERCVLDGRLNSPARVTETLALISAGAVARACVLLRRLSPSQRSRSTSDQLAAAFATGIEHVSILAIARTSSSRLLATPSPPSTANSIFIGARALLWKPDQDWTTLDTNAQRSPSHVLAHKLLPRAMQSQSLLLRAPDVAAPLQPSFLPLPKSLVLFVAQTAAAAVLNRAARRFPKSHLPHAAEHIRYLATSNRAGHIFRHTLQQPPQKIPTKNPNQTPPLSKQTAQLVATALASAIHQSSSLSLS